MRKGKAKMPKGKRIRKGRKKVEREDKEKASKSTLEGGILLYLKGGSHWKSFALLYILDIRAETVGCSFIPESFFSGYSN